MAFFAAIIYILTMLKSLGIAAWISCLVVITYQAISWVISASWPSVTLMDTMHAANIDILSIINSLPFDIAIKAIYVCLTTQLSLFLWWAGIISFGLVVAGKLLFKR